MKTTIIWLLTSLAILLTASAAVTEQTFQDTAFTVMKNIVKSTGANDDKAQQIASEFLKDVTANKGLQLTEKEKREIAKDDYTVANYDAVLKSYAILEKQGGKRMGIFNDYAKKSWGKMIFSFSEKERKLMTEKTRTGTL